MAFDDLIRTGVALADTLTGSLQDNVTHEAWTGRDGPTGDDTWAAGVSRQAIVSRKSRRHMSSTGQELLTSAKILFPRPIAANGASGRVEPIDGRDIITLSDGFTGPVVDVEAIMDPDTNAGYYTTVWLGVSVGVT